MRNDTPEVVWQVTKLQVEGKGQEVGKGNAGLIAKALVKQV